MSWGKYGKKLKEKRKITPVFIENNILIIS